MFFYLQQLVFKNMIIKIHKIFNLVITEYHEEVSKKIVEKKGKKIISVVAIWIFFLSLRVFISTEDRQSKRLKKKEEEKKRR